MPFLFTSLMPQTLIGHLQCAWHRDGPQGGEMSEGWPRGAAVFLSLLLSLIVSEVYF